MNTKLKFALVALPFAAFGFLLQGQSPVGAVLWPPAPMPMEPTAAQLGALVSYSVVEALAFGVGAAFLILAYPRVREAAAVGQDGLWPAYAATGWLLVNWVPHDALHMHVGFDFTGLAAIEWGFHGSIILCGVVLATFLLRTLSGSSAGTAVRSAARPGPTDGTRPAMR